VLNRKSAYAFLSERQNCSGVGFLPSVTSIGPTLPDPGSPDFPSTPSYSSVKVIPEGSGCDTVASSHAFFDALVKNLMWSGHMLYGCAVTIVLATL
jgi:hypothetical protein